MASDGKRKRSNKTVHRSIRSAVFDFRDLTGGCSVMVSVIPRSTATPAHGAFVVMLKYHANSVLIGDANQKLRLELN